jgi:O-acetyl-ADP-ribose deacetylase (regulator of RNase III)
MISNIQINRKCVGLVPSAAQSVDGVVDRLGGTSFRADLHAWLRGGRAKDQGVLCPVGEAASAPSPVDSDLHALYPLIVHTATPTWPRRGTKEVEEHRQWEDRLFSCYQNGFSAAAASHSSSICRHLEIVSPLLGAGTKGAPVGEAARVAANAIAAWLLKPSPRHPHEGNDVANIRVTVLLLVQSEEVGEAVKGCLGQTLGESDSEQR